MSVPSFFEWTLDELDGLAACESWSIGEFASAACLLEASAPKAGNVHPTARFEDMDYEDFRQSASIVGKAFDQGITASCGALILSAVQATRNALGKNTNLGMILLLAPLAKSSRLYDMRAGLAKLLDSLTPDDSLQIYQAIAIAKPGGLGNVSQMDVRNEAPRRLLDAMQLAADWDDIAKQYVTNFADVFDLSHRLDHLRYDRGLGWYRSLVIAQIERLAIYGDSLIARKNDRGIVDRVMQLARDVLDADAMLANHQDPTSSWLALDTFLRADGHRRNPGTTADLLAAATFVSLMNDSKSKKISG